MEDGFIFKTPRGGWRHSHAHGNPATDIFYYHTNHLGSTAFVTDANATITQGFLYAPFGEITTEYTGIVTYSALPKYAFNAKELDEETGMYYYEARYMAPPTFISRDPMFEKYFWMTPYAYCANNPVMYVDPTGMDGEITDLICADQSRGTEYTQSLIASLSKISGLNISMETRKGRTFLSYAKDCDGNPILSKDASGQSIGSETARGMLMQLIDSKDNVNISMGKGGSLAGENSNEIKLDFSQISKFIEGVQGGLNPETMGYGMTFLHEYSHTKLGGGLNDEPGNPGPTVEKINVIRAELNKQGGNYGQRMNYDARSINGMYYIAFDKDAQGWINKGMIPSSMYISFEQ